MVYPALLPLMPHTSAASSRLNWRPPADLNGLVLFARKTQFGFCVCVITCQLDSTSFSNQAEPLSKKTPKSGRTSTSMDDDHVEKVLAVIRQIRRLSVREAAEDVGICKSSYHLILTEERKIRRVAAKLVPRLLTCLSLSMNFWRSMRRLLSLSCPTLYICPLWTSSCSRSGNPH